MEYTAAEFRMASMAFQAIVRRFDAAGARCCPKGHRVGLTMRHIISADDEVSVRHGRYRDCQRCFRRKLVRAHAGDLLEQNMLFTKDVTKKTVAQVPSRFLRATQLYPEPNTT